ncbi:class II aldolase/adducin family protein [Actomonas aquatica]|uniref:Class II aldolase/adducin family protein n=1 Tax=Actomonas aquatica TaxID=2866162 RepID=A0ABZ1CCL8_9BACT|nr:class II aldolase/adducin family protein [Opitutus sp. WL0086]WRQ89238.1 class II aldolase/adducin family protein [Opitutus sp. WL0086]
MSNSFFREQIIDTCLALEARGLNQGTSGNVSVRDEAGTGFFLTPSSLPYHQMTPDDIVHVDLASGTITGTRKPSSEYPFHLAILRARPDAQAVVHTHSQHATAVACLRRDLPAVHYLVALFGGAQIRCAPYATFGTDELSANVVAALSDRRAALMANHGLVVIGRNLDEALALTAEAETLAKLYLQTLAAGTPHILPDDEMARVVDRFRDYGYGPVGGMKKGE